MILIWLNNYFPFYRLIDRTKLIHYLYPDILSRISLVFFFLLTLSLPSLFLIPKDNASENEQNLIKCHLDLPISLHIPFLHYNMFILTLWCVYSYTVMYIIHFVSKISKVGSHCVRGQGLSRYDVTVTWCTQKRF